MEDHNQIQTLLEENNLPTDDLISSNVYFLTQKNNEHLQACIGIEILGNDGLLRSFAVNDLYKNKGFGKLLLDKLENFSQREGLTKLHLLTTTADKYFSKHGYVITDRNQAPDSILKTAEFKDLCPASSIYMTKVL